MSELSANVLPNYDQLTEHKLRFHPDRSDHTDIHPLNGLIQFGPFSRKLAISTSDPIRLAVIVPEGEFPKVRNLIAELGKPQVAVQRLQYLPAFSGFSKVFGVGIDFPGDSGNRVIEIPKLALQAAIARERPCEPLAELMHRAVRELATIRQEFDVAILFLPPSLSSGFKSDEETSDFDLHDSVKALCSTLRMPIQILNGDSMTFDCRASVAWRLSLAIYTKAGGIPWKLDGFEERHAYVGLSYSLRKSTDRRFVTCCSQIFDAEGTNLRFLLYESADGRFEGTNPYLPRTEMMRVMTRTLSLYQQQKGQPPTRLVVHKTTPFTNEEIDGCNDALNSVDDLELVTITQSVPWFGVRIDPPRGSATKGTAAMYPVERGAVLPLGAFDYLLWTQGNCTGIGKGSYFKEGKGVPHPLRVTRYQGSGGFHSSAREILALTKMNWNNDNLYDRLPVTLSYASILARIVKRMGSLSQTPYDFRYFM